MALIECAECGNDVSDKAENCPHCGISLTSILADQQQEQARLAAQQAEQTKKEAEEKAKKEEEDRKLKKFLADRMKARYGETTPNRPLFHSLLETRDTTEWKASNGTADPTALSSDPKTYREWLTTKDAEGTPGWAMVVGIVIIIAVLSYFFGFILKIALLLLMGCATFFGLAHVADSVVSATIGALIVVVISAGIMFSASSSSSSSSSPGCSFPKSSGFTELEKCYDEKLVTERHDMRGCRMSENQSECSILRCGTYDETAWRRANNPDHYGVSR